MVNGELDPDRLEPMVDGVRAGFGGLLAAAVRSEVSRVRRAQETWVIDPNGFVRRRFTGTVTAAGLGSTVQAMREGAP